MNEQAKLDPEALPTLTEWLRQPATEFRSRVDLLAARSRQEKSPEVSKALRLAAQMLPALYSKQGGRS